MKDLIYLPNVVTLTLNKNVCNGCGMCLNVCPHNVFELFDRKARIVRKDYCMECGACELNCPVQAINVKSGPGCAAGIINGLLFNSASDCSCSSEGTNCC